MAYGKAPATTKLSAPSSTYPRTITFSGPKSKSRLKLSSKRGPKRGRP